MNRQHCDPLLLTSGARDAVRLKQFTRLGGEAASEADIRDLVHENPGCLPIAEIDPMFSGPVPICTELNTNAGPIDNFMVTPSGLPVLIECKLWRNPEARRQVVSQILDYAKELTRWSSSDVQREVSHRLKSDGNPLLDKVRAVDPEVDEQQFNDALTANLRRGRFLLLIVGDGIREGVEAIAEYLQLHAGLTFLLGSSSCRSTACPTATDWWCLGCLREHTSSRAMWWLCPMGIWWRLKTKEMLRKSIPIVPCTRSNLSDFGRSS